jgi:hypothetical protein
MARGSSTKARVTSAAETLAGYVDPLVKDEKLRQRLLDALAVGVAARQRAKRQVGVTSLARRLGSDPVLRDQIAELATHLRDVRDHAKLQLPGKPAKKKHRVRNTTLLLAGAGLVLASSPTWRERIAGKLKSIFGEHDDEPTFGEPKAPSPDALSVDESVGPNAPA